MQIRELLKMQDAHSILENIIKVRKNYTYTPSDARPTKVSPFDFEMTDTITMRNDTKLEVSSNLIGKFLNDCEEHYRKKLRDMGLEDVYREPT